MLKINPRQFAVFQGQAERQFVRQVQHALAEKYPHVLPRFPEPIQERIVINMFDRAKRWGIDWQSSLAIFAELMLAIAPNFDEQPEIKEALESDTEQANQIIRTITRRVPDVVWSQAEATTDDLPLFLSADDLTLSLIDQTNSAISLVLWDKVSDIDTRQFAASGCQYAAQLGLDDIDDAPLTLIVWRCLYGSGFSNPMVYSWVNDIMDKTRRPREIVSMIKFRIALDHGRLV